MKIISKYGKEYNYGTYSPLKAESKMFNNFNLLHGDQIEINGVMEKIEVVPLHLYLDLMLINGSDPSHMTLCQGKLFYRDYNRKTWNYVELRNKKLKKEILENYKNFVDNLK